MVTNMGVFFTSKDYLYRPATYTRSRTAVDSDGRVRLVMAHDVPGVHNWLDTQGFERGNLTYRHMLEGRPAVLNTRVVPYDALPTTCRPTPRWSPKPKLAAAMWERFRGIRRRYVL